MASRSRKLKKFSGTGMPDAGMPRFITGLLGEMHTAIRKGGAATAEPRGAEATTKTSLLEFS